jgi:hypothetical protein
MEPQVRTQNPTSNPKPCRLCGGSNLRVTSGPVKPCKSTEVAALYADFDALPCRSSARFEKAA